MWYGFINVYSVLKLLSTYKFSTNQEGVLLFLFVFIDALRNFVLFTNEWGHIYGVDEYRRTVYGNWFSELWVKSDVIKQNVLS